MTTRRAFTLIDLAGILAAVGIIIPLICGQQEAAREAARRKKDETQVRGIHQGFVVWAQNNNDCYPLPSKIDIKDYTVTELGTDKDTTANIYSMMVYNGTVSTEIFISPVEASKNIQVYDKYEFDQPMKSAKPAMALWDPAFSVDFTGGNKGADSYAHLQPSGGRIKRWSNTFKAEEKILSMRGPEVAKVDKNEDGSIKVTLANPKSVTIGMYEVSTSWSGNTAFNDNHVQFMKNVVANGKTISPDSKLTTYKDADGKSWPDIFCHDEQDDPKSTNDYLGLFIKAGSKPADFKAIWD